MISHRLRLRLIDRKGNVLGTKKILAQFPSIKAEKRMKSFRVFLYVITFLLLGMSAYFLFWGNDYQFGVSFAFNSMKITLLGAGYLLYMPYWISSARESEYACLSLVIDQMNDAANTETKQMAEREKTV